MSDVVGYGRTYLKRVGAGRCPLRAEAREVYTVRMKDLPRILGDEDSRIQNFFDTSGASVGVMTDIRAMRHQNAHIEVTGTVAQVNIAKRLIEEAIKEIYDEHSARLAMTSEYLLHDAIEIPLPKAIHLLNDTDLVQIESETLTWIEVDVSRPPRAGEPRQLQILLCGTRRNIDRAILMIKERVSQVKDPKGPGVVKRACKFLWGRVKAVYRNIRD